MTTELVNIAKVILVKFKAKYTKRLLVLLFLLQVAVNRYGAPEITGLL